MVEDKRGQPAGGHDDSRQARKSGVGISIAPAGKRRGVSPTWYRRQKNLGQKHKSCSSGLMFLPPVFLPLVPLVPVVPRRAHAATLARSLRGDRLVLLAM